MQDWHSSDFHCSEIPGSRNQQGPARRCMRKDDIRVYSEYSAVLLWLLTDVPGQCNPTEGDVAFSQPTNSGKALMDAWGQGAVRVFVEDEQQNDEED